VIWSVIDDSSLNNQNISSFTSEVNAGTSASASFQIRSPGSYTVIGNFFSNNTSIGSVTKKMNVACVKGDWLTPRDSDHGIDSINGALKMQAESEHFQLRWPENSAVLTQAQAQQGLETLEKIWKWFMEDAGWVEPYCDSATKYKVQIFTNHGYGLYGSGYGERLPAMWVYPDAITKNINGMVHEFTHTMQFSTMGMRDSLYSGWFWESHAEFMAHQYPGNPDKVGCSASLAWQPHIYYGSTRNRYCNWQFWDYLKNKYGFRVVNDIFNKSAKIKNQDPLEMVMKNQNWSASKLGDEFGEFAMKNVNWDYVDSNGFNRGAEYRKVFGANTQYSWDVSQRLRLAKMVPINLSERKFHVSQYFAPQRYGYNLVKLIPDAGAKSIAVDFRGVVQSEKVKEAEYGDLLFEPGAPNDWSNETILNQPASNWRFGLVALDKDGQARRSALQSGARGLIAFNIEPTDTEIYMVVVAAPDVFHKIFWDQKYHTIYRFPWKAKFINALPDGYQAGYQNGFPAGRAHSNGGGWVADGANVADTAYVGPRAAVLGGSVLGNARVEDEAIVWQGLLSDSAVVGGLTQLNRNISLFGNASIHAIMAGGQVFNDSPRLIGNVKLYGDIEAHIGGNTNTYSAGALTGFLTSESMRDVQNGTGLTRLPIEVTAPIPAGWPD
jgi:hypothetical protein